MDFDNFTPDQLAKARDLSVEELIKFAEEEGIELTDEQMEAVNGGKSWFDRKHDMEIECPSCHKTIAYNTDHGRPNCCPYCGRNWKKINWGSK